MGPTGAPIQTVVPVTDSATKPGVAAAPLPPNNGSAATFTPPPATPNGKLGLEPTVITPSGAANLSIDSVSDVQNALTTLGVAKLAADGKSGPATAAAVTVFQSAHGLPSTGIIDPPLKAALQSALASLAGTQKHIGQSLPVQAAAVGASTPDSPLGASIVSAGLHKIVSLFQGLFHSDVGAEGADLPKTDDHKAALIKLQRVLNLLGASPPLDESGTMTPETTAAIKCFQVTYGLVADGVPLQKTVAAMALAVDPAAQAAILPSVPKAADHVASLAATEDPKSEIKAPLAAFDGLFRAGLAFQYDPQVVVRRGQMFRYRRIPRPQPCRLLEGPCRLGIFAGLDSAKPRFTPASASSGCAAIACR